MEKNYLIVTLVQAFMIISLAFLFPVTAHSQDLTAEQRQERCQNNKNRIAELEKQLASVNAELSNAWTQKEIDTARTQMFFVRKMKRPGGKDASEWAKYDKIAAQYHFDDGECQESIADAPSKIETCITELEYIIGKKIDKATSLNRPGLLAKQKEIEKQISNHRTNLIALGCDGKTSGGAGSLKLVGGPEILGKSRKEAYNSVVYSEYSYSNNSATLTIQGDPPDRRVIKWQFGGIPGSLTPGDSITITITGSLEINKGGDIQPWPSAGVRVTGLTLASGENAYVSVNQKRDGKYVFKVPLNAKLCTIEIGADWGLGTFARYRYEK